MKFFYDFFPLIAFFGSYQYTKDMIFATGILIVATIFQVGYLWIKNHKIEKMHLITLVFVVTLGGATILLQDDSFIKWKPTVVNWILALVFLGSEFIGEKSLIRRMLEANIELPILVWRNINIGWVLFFSGAGALNLYVAFNYPQETWVNFKVFGLLGLTIIFVLIQGVYMAKYLKDDTETNETEN